MSSASEPRENQRPVAEFFRREPGILLTAGYILLSAVGMTYKYFLFQNFGVNVFDVSDVNDFLIAGLRHPVVLGFTALSYLVVWTAVTLQRKYRSASKPKIHESRAYLMGIYGLLMTLWFVAMAIFYAQTSAREIASGRGQEILLTIKGAPKSKSLVGTTSRFIVTYDRTSKSTSVIPIEQVEGIEYGAASESPSPASSPEP